MVIYEQNDMRISLITPRLLRIEKGAFTDYPTQTVLTRDLDAPSFTLEHNGQICTIQTEEVSFKVNIATAALSCVIFSDGNTVTDFKRGILPGTARTLDRANGSVKLLPGIMSRSGVSVMDDSKSLLLLPDGSIAPRSACKDCYYFAYGHDYQRQLKDFFRLTGAVPLIPKYALGNWWSRYKAYSQDEYQSLMQKFIDRQIPVTVATIDMDWHWTDVVTRFGKKAKSVKPSCKDELLYNLLLHGWTGYSWNTELFPDHKALLAWLHENGFHTTLNVHPSQGVRFFEDSYESMCRRMGKDPATKEFIPFEPTDPQFMQAYFEELHHPLEDEGVDFWWLDWQQGTKTKTKGLDPLWILNHLHTLDNARNQRRPLILSRYAGFGSHRYPLGFSGDTFCTWKSLHFQPYFTNSAANSGYTWWSHDIGGHMHGIQDDELYLRWLQYGVFSPINRLHSSNSDFMGKEPWKHGWAVEKIAENFLRLRHKLIPYLYTANYQTHQNGTPICMPMYYRYDQPEAYEAKNQYIFGGQLLVCPITRPADKRLNLAYADVWLPEGRWTDIFNGRIYKGGRWVRMYRDIDSIPVLAPAGAIVPMYRTAETNNISLEQPLEVHIWHGCGQYELYEDDGESTAFREGHFAKTLFTMEEANNTLQITINPPANNFELLPECREIYLKFRDLDAADLCVTISNEPIKIEIPNINKKSNEPYLETREAILTRVQAGNDWKKRHFRNHLPRFVQQVLAEPDALE